MHRVVAAVFKTIAISMILLFVFDMVFYMYRVASLNQRVENIMTAMQKVVMQNNYLPLEDARMFKQLLAQMANDFNDPHNFQSNTDNNFIVGMRWNVGQSAVDSKGHELKSGTGGLDVKGTRQVWNETGWSDENDIDLVHYTMNEVGGYGDIQCIQLVIRVNQPMWGFSTSGYTGPKDAPSWNRVDGNQTNLFFTYFVPCLKYQSITTS